MPDATPAAPVTETLIDIDIDEIKFRPRVRVAFYRIVKTYSSGREVYEEKVIPEAAYNSVGAAIFQANPLRKLLTWLVANGYESNLIIN